MRMKKVQKRMMALIMVVMMCVVCSFTGVEVHAEEANDYLLNKQGTLYAADHNSESYTFYSDKYQKANVIFIVDHPVELFVSLKASGSSTNSDRVIYPTQWEAIEVEGQQVYTFALWSMLHKATYTYTISANEDVSYLTVVDPAPTISATSTTITAGQKATLEVINADDTITWSSNKKTVATVSSKGVVTAKKAGTATITATVGEEKLTCKVTVKKNVYTRTKVKISEVKSGVTPQIYNVSYNSNGTMTCKVLLFNKSGRKVKKLQDVVITITNENGKTIAKQKFSKKAVSIANNKSKSVTFTITKKNVKKKSADLRNASCDIDGNWT